VLENGGWTVRDYASCEAFLADWTPEREGCLLVDALLPGMGGIDLLKTLPQRGAAPPAVMITGAGDVAMAMAAMREGALDFIEKPVRPAALLASLTNAAARLDRLTPRERQVMALVLDGRANNLIVADLGISQRTVENHRAAVMRKTEAGSLPGLAWLALAAAKAGG
jgi:two-component system CheB/CheR fusion protein